LENSISGSQCSYHILKTQLSDDTWKSAMIHLLISDNLLVRLNVCYRKINLIKSVDASDLDNDMVRSTKEEFCMVLEILNNEITELSR
ncbi:MAG: hypothetical protein K0Q87_5112, partial [Neobacillus sp.]|nr:hypothetical protein [Neobacillus sp.]